MALPLPRLFRLGLPLLFLSALPGLASSVETTDNRDEILHVLNRVTFGPRPGDVEMVQKMGLHNYIEAQLHPEAIDDSAVEQMVTQYDLLQMSPQELVGMFYGQRKDRKEVRKAEAAQYATEDKAKAAQPEGQAPMEGEAADKAAMMKEPAAPPPPLDNIPAKPVDINAVIAKAEQLRSIAAVAELEHAKLIRAVYSQRQLQEVLVDFWGNHFNIDVKKGPDSVLKVVDDREVIRPNIWGKFRDLLEASAKSPAMLHYLDNDNNTVAREAGPMEQQMQAMMYQKITGKEPPPEMAPTNKPKKQGGINENYAREIMELHTLGVDGGYTQQDVQEVARCFTGWGIDKQNGTFAFHPRQHDNGAKTVLGHQIPAGGGMKDGELVLDILASSPATAHHIAYQLCQRFVADDPPASVVNRTADVFTQTGGDLRAVTEAILTSPEFLNPATYGNKIKSPLEFAVSAVRASDATLIPRPPPPLDRLTFVAEGAGATGRQKAVDRISKNPRQSLNWHIVDLGQPLFACTPPTGYKETSTTWVSPGALIERLNFAMALTQQNLSDVTFNPQKILGDADLDKPDAVLNQCLAVYLQGNATDATRKVLKETALPAADSNQTVNPSKLIALIIGSPEFQRK